MQTNILRRERLMSKCLSCQVSNEGDVLYVLPRGFRGAIAARSWRLRAEPAIKRVQFFPSQCCGQPLCCVNCATDCGMIQ